MAKRKRQDRRERGLVELRPVKLEFVAASRRASEEVRSCAGCDAHCCRVDYNSMLVSRIEAAALAERLREPDLAGRIPEILAKARRQVEERGLDTDPDATYDCPLLDENGGCLVHGPAQPAGCLTFTPVEDGGCDHDLDFFQRHYRGVRRAERSAFGREFEPVPIPVALLRVLRLLRRP